MDIYLGTFLKRVNSTARPAVESLTKYDCTFRRAVSLLAPAVAIKTDADLHGYNYGYIPKYNRWYHVADIRVGPRGYWMLSLSVDVLATYRPEISGATEYVARCAADYDGDLQDGMYPSKAGARVAMTTKAPPWVSDLYTGTFVVGCVNGITGASSTALTYYAMDAAEYSDLLGRLQNQTTMADILGITVSADGIVENLSGCLQGISYDVYLAQVNPIQYVVSSVYIPLTKDQLGTEAATNVKLGPFDMDMGTVTTIGYRAVVDLGAISVPKHPQAGTRGSYLNAPPHSVYSTHFPGFGVVELDGARVGRWDSINAKAVFNPYDGSAYLYLNTSDPDEDEGALAILTGNIGIPVPVTQLLATDLKGNLIANVAKVASNLLSDKGGVMTSLGESFSGYWDISAGTLQYLNPLTWFDSDKRARENEQISEGAAKLTGAWDSTSPTAVLDGVQAVPTLAMSGSAGGSAGLYGNWWLKLEYFLLVAEDNESLGRPLMQPRQLGTLSGYVQVIGPHIQTWGTAQETAAVNQTLASGFFME